jgi:protein-L-isoaspartate O-methyltransferase
MHWYNNHVLTTPNPTAVECPVSNADDDSDRRSDRSPGMSATYSPEDNKLRLSSVNRLDAETYQRVKAAGFIWAAKQGVFVAPMWTPEREDLLLELCGEIGDEDTTLVDRAEQRADRFEGYRENRAADAEAAKRAVETITNGIPLGQPILVGHHSERRARKDAERIESGMRRAIKMWDTAEYWKSRAAGALQHAKYKERPDVRHRRIKGLETDRRREEKRIAEWEEFATLWQQPGITLDRAKAIANYDHVPVDEDAGGTTLWWMLDRGRISAADAAKVAIASHAKAVARARRWLAHIQNRIAYERAMLGDAGGLPAERFDIVVGGQVLVRREWVTVLRVNRKDGRVVSVRTNAQYVPLRSIEEIQDYRPPAPGMEGKVKAASKLPPLCNYPGEGFREMTKAEWERYPGGAKVIRRERATNERGAHRMRYVGGWQLVQVYLTDAKRCDPPPAGEVAPELPLARVSKAAVASVAAGSRPISSPRPFEVMRAHLRQGGVQVVSVPQLFPTPPALAAKIVELAELSPGQKVLEPSAGTGAILEAVAAACVDLDVTAVEISRELAERLGGRWRDVRNADFLELSAEQLGCFDRIVMNPPFASGQDIQHILRARDLLRPGGRIVAVCAAGPRQHTALLPLVKASGGTWEELPADTFAGTSVRAILLTIKRSGTRMTLGPACVRPLQWTR